MKKQPRKFARVIVVNQAGQVLAVCQPSSKMPRYCFPGGKVETAESPKAAASRELYEELGLRIAPSNLRHCLTSKFSFGDEEWIGYYYVGIHRGLRPTLMEYPKITSAQFYSINDLAALPCDRKSFLDVASIAQPAIRSTQERIAPESIFA